MPDDIDAVERYRKHLAAGENIAQSPYAVDESCRCDYAQLHADQAALARRFCEQPSGEDTERLDWLDGQGGSVLYSVGYLKSKNSWSYKRGSEIVPAENLRAAIDAAMNQVH